MAYLFVKKSYLVAIKNYRLKGNKARFRYRYIKMIWKSVRISSKIKREAESSSKLDFSCIINVSTVLISRREKKIPHFLFFKCTSLKMLNFYFIKILHSKTACFISYVYNESNHKLNNYLNILFYCSPRDKFKIIKI